MEDAVLRKVRRHFGDLADEHANPLVVALALQDTSSVGLQIHADEFGELHRELRSRLKSHVDENYEGFNASVGAWRSVVTGVNSSHQQLARTKRDLESVRESLGKRKPVLHDLQESSMRYKQMLDLLDAAERLQQAPAAFERHIAAKQFRAAHHVLADALESLAAHDLARVPELGSIHTYVVEQQAALLNALVDDLVAHVYLLSPYTESRWRHPDPTALEQFLSELDTQIGTDRMKDIQKLSTETGSSSTASLARETDQASEQHSFRYIRSILDTLAALDCVVPALEKLQSRISEDLKNLHERTVTDIVRQVGLTPDQLIVSDEGSILDQFRAVDQTLLRCLISELYAKLGAVLEAHRVIHEVSSRYGVSYDLQDVASAVGDEVRSLLLQYVDAKPSNVRVSSSRTSTSSRSMRRPATSKVAGPIFQFGSDEADSESVAEFDELRQNLERSVPGLVRAAERGPLPGDSPFAEIPHKSALLVVAPAHVLNIRTMLEPTATFLARARAIMPDVDTFDQQFLDSFLRRQFVPRLQQTIGGAFNEIADAPDALATDPASATRSQLPIIRFAAEVVDLAALGCQLLNTGDEYREDYTAILIDLIGLAEDWIKTRASELQQVGARRMTQDVANEVASRLKELRHAPESNPGDLPAYWKRRHVPATSLAGSSKVGVVLGDLLDLDAVRTLMRLATSIEWMNVRLRAMRQVAPSSRPQRSVKRWTLADAALLSRLDDRHPTAVLAGRQLERFDAIVGSLDDLAQNVIGTLRVDLMLRTVYFFDQMVLRGDYKSRQPKGDRDPAVTRLQLDLSTVAQASQMYLTEADFQFLVCGIAQLMNELFVLESDNIPEINAAGHDRMNINIFALQQMLTSILPDPHDVDFSRATSFYDLFRLTPTLVLDRVREGDVSPELSREDVRRLLRHKYKVSGGSMSGALAEHLHQLDVIFGVAISPATPGPGLSRSASILSSTSTTSRPSRISSQRGSSRQHNTDARSDGAKPDGGKSNGSNDVTRTPSTPLSPPRVRSL